jgi:uncharacterized RDD family membrane protein YckC
MSTAHPGEDDPTTAMPRVEARQAAPRVPYTPPPVEEAIVVGPAAPAPPRRLTNISPAIVGTSVGNPFGYALARLVAVVIDLGLVAGVLTLLAYALIAINPITGLPTNTQRGFDATLAMGFVLALIYGISFEALFGTTFGKLAMGLHVHAVRDQRLGFGRAFVRSILRPFDLLVIGGVLAMLPGHRRLGDLAAGTVVTRGGPLRGYAPYVGWLAVALIAAVPFILVGVTRTVAGLVAFVEFAPGIGARLILLAHHAIALVPH